MITDAHVEKYLYAVLPGRDAVLREMERQAKERDIPIVGPAVGRLFYQYARAMGAKHIFEMGSAIGYSTIWWARALEDGGTVHYTDGSRKNADEASGYFERAGVSDRIRLHVGDALELLSARNEEFDILFCDVDKHDYPRVFHMAAGHVRRGGLFIIDNVLWHGDVAYAAGNPDLKSTAKPDKNTQAIVELNRLLYDSTDWFTTILPLRDGVAVALRL